MNEVNVDAKSEVSRMVIRECMCGECKRRCLGMQ